MKESQFCQFTLNDILNAATHETDDKYQAEDKNYEGNSVSQKGGEKIIFFLNAKVIKMMSSPCQLSHANYHLTD